MTSSNGQNGGYSSANTSESHSGWTNNEGNHHLAAATKPGWWNPQVASVERPQSHLRQSHLQPDQQHQRHQFQQSQQMYLSTPPRSTSMPPQQQQPFSWLSSGTPPSVGSPPSVPLGSYTQNGMGGQALPMSVLPQQATTRTPPPPPPPPHIGNGTVVQASNSSSSHAQHRFDEIFMTTQPRPPQPPSRSSHPLVPQQIRRKPTPKNNWQARHSDSPRGGGAPALSSSSPATRVVTTSTSSNNNNNSSNDSDADGSAPENNNHRADDTFTTRKRQKIGSNGSKETVKRTNTKGGKATSVASEDSTFGKTTTTIDDIPSSAAAAAAAAGSDEAAQSEPVAKNNNNNNNESGVRQKKKKQLELLRAKVALAKQKKIAMEKEASMKDTHGALERARAKLRGAMQERAIANNRHLPAISALSTSMIITNISETGPEDMVYFTSKNMDFELEAEKLNERMLQADEQNTDSSVGGGGASSSLAARKSQLQKELLLLKEKLESKQGIKTTKDQDGESDTDADASPDEKSKQVLTKEELQRRREEAQAQMDLSYWKHFVSKQEHILVDVTSQLQDNLSSLKTCESDLEKTEELVESTNAEIVDLEAREKIVSDLISEATANLLKKRKEFHSLQENQMSRSA